MNTHCLALLAVFLPIVEEYAPSITIQIDTVGLAPRSNIDSEKDSSAPPRAALATGVIMLKVPPVCSSPHIPHIFFFPSKKTYFLLFIQTTKELHVEAAPRHAKIMPGGDTTLDVKARTPSLLLPALTPPLKKGYQF